MKNYIKNHVIDLVITISLVIVSIAILLGFHFLTSTKNWIASIYVQNKLVEKIDLSKETTKRTISIQGVKSEMTLVVDHEYIAVTESSCPAKTCIHSSPLTSAGTIICTYNQVRISVGDTDYDVEVG